MINYSAFASFGATLCFVVGAFAADPSPGPREVISFDANWHFHHGDDPAVEEPGFDDSNWRTVDVPHDWSIEGPYDRNAPASGLGGYLPTGIGWYRRHFVAPESWRGKKVSVEFDGVYMRSDVWINGHHLGQRPFGYSGFEYDLTPELKLGETNIIAVRVDNSRQPNSRWYSGSGIYRHMWLIVTAPLHVAHWGTCVTTPKISAESAMVEIRTRIQNEHSSDQRATLDTQILDPQDQVIATTESQENIAANAEREFSQSLEVANPILWSLDSPTLYRIRNLVKVGNEVVDEYETPFGIRSIRYDADKGFFLNDQPVKMQGLCLHHDGGCVGAAVPEGVWERRLRKLKDMGCNAIRASHNPPAPEFLNLCDRLGFLVMDEAFDEWRTGQP